MAAVNCSGWTSLTAEDSELRCRVHPAEGGSSTAPTLIYLPGLHGDWTLLGPFRHALRGRCRLVEFCYPRRVDWTLDDYARGVLAELERLGIREGWWLGESFSSQVLWALARQCPRRSAAPGRVRVRTARRAFNPVA